MGITIIYNIFISIVKQLLDMLKIYILFFSFIEETSLCNWRMEYIKICEGPF